MVGITHAVAKASKTEAVHVALLRGINVGGKNSLAMSDLNAIFVALGCFDVKTYIQSGNVIFRAPAGVVQRLPDIASRRIRERLGLAVPVLVRADVELDAVVRNNPFLRGGVDVKALHVLFLRDHPNARSIAGLDPRRSPADSFVVRGREVYLCCPNGVGRTRLTNDYFDRALATTSTGRNWRTVLKLHDLATQ